MTVGGYRLGRDDTGLTRRERQVEEAITRGDTHDEIADRLGVTRQRVGQLAAQARAKRGSE